MKVILKHGKKWLFFDEPKEVLRADQTGEVLPLLKKAEHSNLFAAGCIAYEAASAFDASLQTHSHANMPLLYLGLFDQPQVLDAIDDLPRSSFTMEPLTPSISKPQFIDSIERIKSKIAEGATYQVNYTYRLQSKFSGDAWSFFHHLVQGQRADYAAFIETDDFSICSASPELFFQCSGNQILARPMKGTARRGRTFSEDWNAAERLQLSEKDRAENIMIVDMIRNDLGRIATTGSVNTLSQYDIHKYPTVWQMTSTVQAQRPAHTTRTDIFEALFPCASITGAPKTKTMEIIKELEPAARNIYTGSIGFMNPNGDACFNVAIRTALINHKTNSIEFGVGGGIVWDSDAEAEYEETITKARVLTQERPHFELLETILWEPETGLFLLNEHIQRLSKSAAYFDIDLNTSAILQALEDHGATLKDTSYKARLLVDHAGDFSIESDAIEISKKNCSIALAPKPIDTQDRFLFHKTTHRPIYQAAKAAFPQHDEVILWNTNHEITEGTFTNIVIKKGDRLITPPVQSGLLAGTFRAHLLKEGRIEEEIISIDDLKQAKEIYLINSVRRWIPATLSD